MKEPRHAVSRSQQAAALRKNVRSAHELLQQAHSAYDEALAIAWDTDLGPDGFLALQQQGRAYAAAVINYSNAVMALLSHMETARAEIQFD